MFVRGTYLASRPLGGTAHSMAGHPVRTIAILTLLLIADREKNIRSPDTVPSRTQPAISAEPPLIGLLIEDAGSRRLKLARREREDLLNVRDLGLQAFEEKLGLH